MCWVSWGFFREFFCWWVIEGPYESSGKKIRTSGWVRPPLDWREYEASQGYRTCTNQLWHWRVHLSPHIPNWCQKEHCWLWGTLCNCLMLLIHTCHSQIVSCACHVFPWIQLCNLCMSLCGLCQILWQYTCTLNCCSYTCQALHNQLQWGIPLAADMLLMYNDSLQSKLVWEPNSYIRPPFTFKIKSFIPLWIKSLSLNLCLQSVKK